MEHISIAMHYAQGREAGEEIIWKMERTQVPDYFSCESPEMWRLRDASGYEQHQHPSR